MSAARIADAAWRGCASGPLSLAATLEVTEDIAVDVDAIVTLMAADGTPLERHCLSHDALDVCWLPRGRYGLAWTLARGVLPPGAREVDLAVHARVDGHRALVCGVRGPCPSPQAQGASCGAWTLAALDATLPIESLPWKIGMDSWFFQHFDHAARTIVEYMGADSPLLRGRVLDVGCGDGVTDLGIALRYAPREIVGIDPFRGYERLPGILGHNGLGHLAIPPNLRFQPDDANALSFDDDTFDAVISWSAVEHFAGGYVQALREMRRVLRPGGLLFIHPELYYSATVGSHLSEYSREPHFHLTRSDDEIRAVVMNAQPRYIDRGDGAAPSREEHWRWFKELNRITVPQFEDELRALGFEPWRLALRAEPMVEYREGLHAQRFTDIGIAELYVTCYNRKG